MPEQEIKVSYLKAFENPVVIKLPTGDEIYLSLKNASSLGRKLIDAVAEAIGGE